MLAHVGKGSFDEEARGAHAGYAPDDVGGAAGVPGYGFGDEGAGVVGGGDVGGDVEESLGLGVFCYCLRVPAEGCQSLRN